MNKFLKDLIVLADELNKAENFNNVLVISEIEKLYEQHISELKKTDQLEIKLFDSRSDNAIQSITIDRMRTSLAIKRMVIDEQKQIINDLFSDLMIKDLQDFECSPDDMLKVIGLVKEKIKRDKQDK